MSNSYLIIFLVILVIFIIFIIFGNRNGNNCNNFIQSNFIQSNNQYLSKEETFNFLFADLDNYIHNFNNSDLISRKVSSIDNYLYQISNSAASFTNAEKKYLDKITLMANNTIKNIDVPFAQQLANIQFTFAKTNNNNYENGFPHTRENIIFLATPFFKKSEDDAISTIIHEKTHLFQRFYPNETHNYLQNNGYTLQGKLSQSEMQLKRSNPDINNDVWTDSDGNLMLPLFNNINPKSMSDLATSEQKQHPYEEMAYSMEGRS